MSSYLLLTRALATDNGVRISVPRMAGQFIPYPSNRADKFVLFPIDVYAGHSLFLFFILPLSTWKHHHSRVRDQILKRG